MGGVLFDIGESALLEFIPLLIYSVLVKPVRKDLKEFYKYKGKYKYFS